MCSIYIASIYRDLQYEQVPSASGLGSLPANQTKSLFQYVGTCQPTTQPYFYI